MGKENSEVKSKIKEILKQNPRLSNREIGKLVGLTRNAVQWHIKSLGITRNRKELQRVNNTKRSFEINISDNAEQIILGSILGDGSISKWKRSNDSKLNLNSKLSILHTEPQLDYLLYKKKLLEENGIRCAKIVKTSKEKIALLNPTILGRPYTINNRYTLYTRRAVSFNKYRDLFYKSKKYINRYIYKLKPLGLAIWYMDDGNKLHNTYTFNTQCFDLKSLKILQKMLLHNFNIKTSLNKASVKHYRIYIRRESADLFYSLVKPFICKSMEYKLYIK